MFLEIENEIYSLDLNKIFSLIFTSQNNKNIESSQSLVYAVDENDEKGDNMKLISKELTENKNSDNLVTVNSIKYDLIKQLIDVLMNIGVKTSPFGDVVENDTTISSSLDNMGVGEIISFNTLLNEGILINIKLNNDGK